MNRTSRYLLHTAVCVLTAVAGNSSATAADGCREVSYKDGEATPA